MRKRNAYLIFLAVMIAVSGLWVVNSTAAEEKKKAFVISYFHYDPVWTNSQSGETARAFASIHQDLEYAEMEQRFKFVLSETDYLKPYWDAYPRDRQRLLKLAAEGRIEFTGGYNEPDEAAVGGEALIRNFVFGKLYKEWQFGTKVTTVTQYDVYGHTPQLPRILLGTGHKYAVYQRGNNTDMPSEFNWLGADGSTIFTKQRMYPGAASDASLNAGKASSYDLTNNAMFTSGDDFREPDRTIGKQIKKTKGFEIVSGTNADFFEAVENSLKESGVTVPDISRDQTFVFEGCFGSRIDTKFANRLIEGRLVDAEKFSTIDSLKLGAPYPWKETDRAWRLLFFGEHHDALPGTQTENVNLDLLVGWREALQIANKQYIRAAADIAAKIDTASVAPKGVSVPIVVFNSLNWSRNEPVEAVVSFPKPVKAFKVVGANGKPVVFQLKSAGARANHKDVKIFVAASDVPSMGYLVLYAVACDKYPAGAVTQFDKGATLENDLYRIVADPERGGDIKSIYSKTLKREFIDTGAGLGNEIISYEEKGKSAPDVLALTGRFWRSGDYPVDSIEIEHGAVFDRMIIKSSRRDAGLDKRYPDETTSGAQEVLPDIVKEIIIYKKNPRIDFKTHFNAYRGRDMLFKVGFPASLPNATPVFEERFATIARERNTIDYLSKKGEGAAFMREYPINYWHGLSPAATFTFVNDSGDAVSKYPLAIGELITPQDDGDALKSANKLAAALVKAGVTTTPTADKRNHANSYYGFRVSLGYGMNNVYTEKLLDGMDAGLIDKLNSDIAEKGVGFLFIESPDSATAAPEVPSSIPILIIEAKTKDGLEKAVDALVSSLDERGEINLPSVANATIFKDLPGGYGMALINNGNPGGSVEYPNTITLTLTRSSSGDVAGVAYSDDWLIANFNQTFRYSLLPFKGGWDEAGIVRAGYCYNFPLIARQDATHKGPLPGGSHSFLNTGGANVVVTTLKPAGYPVAQGEWNIKGTNNLIIRMYNPGVRKTDVNIALDFNAQSIYETDFLESAVKYDGPSFSGNSFPVSLSQFDVRSYLIGVDRNRTYFKPTSPQAEHEVSPIYTRYWDTNQNAAPEGFMPVTVTIEPVGFSDDRKTMNFTVTVAGNVSDQKIAGELKFKLPPGAKIVGDTKYDLPPYGVKTFTLHSTGLDPRKLTKEYIAVQIEFGGRTYEDVLTFSNWRVHTGDIDKGGAAVLDDSAWETVPLARFWSAADNKPGTTWYRRKIFIPANIKDIQFLFDRPADSEVDVYMNGFQVRHEKLGTAYRSVIGKEFIRFGKDNIFAIRYMQKGGTNDPAWSMSLRGSEAAFFNKGWTMKPTSLTMKPGEAKSFTVTYDNPFDQVIEGEAVLASPIYTWNEGGAYSLLAITPSARYFTAKPSGRASVTFGITVPPDAQPGNHVVAVKLIFKGNVVYTDPMRITIKK
jgi:alpha-mannosidase